MTQDEVRAILDGQLKHADPDGSYRYLYRITGGETPWLERFPSGFQAHAPNEDLGWIVAINVVADSIAHLDEATCEEYVLSLCDWLFGSALPFERGDAPDEVLNRFIDKCPSEATVLASIAAHHGYTLSTWLCGRS